jgi:hypothetical protein
MVPRAPAAADPSAGPRVEHKAYLVSLEASPTRPRSGVAARATLRLEGRAGYHINADYPAHFTAAADATVDFPAVRMEATGTRAPCAGHADLACASVAEVPFTPRAGGPGRIAGVFAFSVCDPEVCLIEKVPLAVTVAGDGS